MNLRVRLTEDVLSTVETFLTDRGAIGAEGTGLVACRADGADGWVSVRFHVEFVVPVGHLEHEVDAVAVERTVQALHETGHIVFWPEGRGHEEMLAWNACGHAGASGPAPEERPQPRRRSEAADDGGHHGEPHRRLVPVEPRH